MGPAPCRATRQLPAPDLIRERQRTFFSDEDYDAYIDLARQQCQRFVVAIWAWCLMPNLVHLTQAAPGASPRRVAVPETASVLSEATRGASAGAAGRRDAPALCPPDPFPLFGGADGLTETGPLASRIPDWRAYLAAGSDSEIVDALRGTPEQDARARSRKAGRHRTTEFGSGRMSPRLAKSTQDGGALRIWLGGEILQCNKENLALQQ